MVKSFVELLEISGVNEEEWSLCFEESRERCDGGGGGGGGGSFGEDGEGLEGIKRDKKFQRAEDAIGWIESEYCNFLSVFADKCKSNFIYLAFTHSLVISYSGVTVNEPDPIV